MSYTFMVEQKRGYFHVRVSGENTPESVARYLAEVHDTCARLNCPNVLIEENLRGPQPRHA